MHLRWACITLLLPILAQADNLENRMQRCQWELSEWYMPKFQQARKSLPQDVKVILKSCGTGGPTYQLKAKQRTVELQDGWREGDRSTAYFFSTIQASPGYWTFDHSGYEWSGLTFVDKITGESGNTPCNHVAAMHYNPKGSRAVFMCTLEYGEDAVQLYAAVLDGKLRFVRLNAEPPGAEISVVWKSDTLAAIRFLDAARKISVRQYNIRD
jgi:hypothetical protein